MTEIKDLLDQRTKMKAHKPHFLVHDSHKRKEIRKRWRKPKGLHNKMRLGKKGYPIMVSMGWRSPKKVRGFHGSGFKVKIINSVSDLKGIDNKIEAIIISSSVGTKKRLLIIEESQKNSINILNFKDVDAYVKKVKDQLEKAKDKKAKKISDKKEKDTDKKTKEKKKDTLAEKIQTEEDKKDQEKKEKDKVLTKKDAI